VSPRRAAELMGRSRERVDEIVDGRAPVTIDTAIRLEFLVGVREDSWLRRIIQKSVCGTVVR